MIRALTLAGLLGLAAAAAAQEVRRAQPVDEPPVARAIPFEEEPLEAATPKPRPRRVPPAATPKPKPKPEPEEQPAPTTAPEEKSEPAAEPSEAADKRQLDYANGLFGQKQYDLAAPEYEKFLGLYPTSPERANAYFYLGECYRALNRAPAAKSSFQSVVDQFPDNELAGPAAYGVAEISFTQKDYAGALPLFHKAGAKTKQSALALSARYFEARCLEYLNRKDEARDIYLQVIDVKDPNPYRDDARLAAGSIWLAAGRKAEALKQFEALSNETQKGPLKAEAAVRAGMIAVDLQQTAKATALLQKARTLPEAGRWRGVSEVGLLRLQYQAGQYAQLVADFKKSEAQIPEDIRPEIMLLAANSQRQLGHNKEAEEAYRQIIEKYPARDEAKEAQYQRLISLYNSNAPSLQKEADLFLQTNPTGERAEQAKLLQAETFYKQQAYGDAAPLYADLRAAQLSPKLRAEAAYKLGWCYVQTKEPTRVLEAFSYFLKAFPENAQVPSALAQRALAYQSSKNYDAALADLNLLLAKYPQAREREAALQQKALIFGQQDNPSAMAETFAQLLKEFPKSAAAAQADYYIGKAAFDAKKYAAAIPPLDLARQLNQEQYYTLATLRIISSEFYLKQRDALAKEVNAFTASGPNAKVPAEILEWLGIEFYNDKKYAEAAKYLTALAANENPGNVKPEFWFYLGDAQLKLNNAAPAEDAFQKYLQSATDPAARAKALLALGQAKIGAHKPDEAQKIAEEIMSLQPEGRVNAEARLLAGDVQVERARFEEASKAFMGVALLYDDPAITPRALQKAALAYQKSGKQDEANRVQQQLQLKYPGFAGG